MVRDARSRPPAPTAADIGAVLADEDCRSLLAEMDRPRTVANLAERADVPLSTAYRKIERMDEAALLDEVVQIREDGRHTSQYGIDFERIVISIDADRSLAVNVERPPRTADERLEDMWTRMRQRS